MSASGSRMRRKNLYLIGAWIIAPVLAAVVYFTPDLGAWSYWLTLAAFFAAAGLSVAWFVALDEVAQRAHYEAWFWGGTLGLFVLPLGVMLLRAFGDHGQAVEWLLSRFVTTPDLTSAFVAGIFAALAPLLVGYTLWWAAFWLRNR